MEYSPIYKKALGAVWTAGFRPTREGKSELKRACGYSIDYRELLQNGGAESAIKALESCGYPIAENPDFKGYDLLIPQPCPAVSVPMAAHKVRLESAWSTMKAGQYVALQGALGLPADGFTIANANGGWHAGTDPDRQNYISMGCGGPASILKLHSRVLKPTGEISRLRAWSWIETPCANGGADFLITVPVWSWTPADNETDFLRFEESFNEND